MIKERYIWFVPSFLPTVRVFYLFRYLIVIIMYSTEIQAEEVAYLALGTVGNVSVSSNQTWDVSPRGSGKTFAQFMCENIRRLRETGRRRTAETYEVTLRRFTAFCADCAVFPRDITPALVQSFEDRLRAQGLSPNSTSFYMRVLRAVYNRAVSCGLTPQRHPFADVYTGIGATAKRAVAIEIIGKIKKLDLNGQLALEMARDLFLFSFYTRGMSFIDMAKLRVDDIHGGVLTYRRHKTGQLLQVKWESCMQKIVDRYVPLTAGTPYLLPILTGAGGERRYQSVLRQTNRNLRRIGRMVGLLQPLTTYVARHSWASSARKSNIPLSVISAGMGHTSERTTRIYLAELDASEINRANSRILRALE